MKTLEFKLELNKTRQEQIGSWLEIQRQVWNKGLELLKEFEQFCRYNKQDKTYALCCPIPWQYRWIKDGDKFIPIPYCQAGFRPKYGEYRQSCPIPQYYREPAIFKSLINPKTGTARSWQSAFASLFAHDINPWLNASGCPAKVTQATIKRLTTAWEQYLKGKRKQPRFKKFGDFDTISDNQSGNAVHIENNRLKLPKLGKVRVKGLDSRWGGLEIKTYHIKREPSGFYIYLVGEVEQKIPKLTDKAVGIDPGVKAAITLDDGRQYKPANPLKTYQKRLIRLQRKLSRQVPKSNGWEKTKALIARTYEKIRRTRKAFNHKLSTKIVREFGAVAFEGTRLQNMVRRPKAKIKEDGTGYEHNRAAQKAGLNKALLDVAIGQLRSLTEQKCAAWDREFTKPEPQNTSITCNVCGVIDKASRLSQSEFKCVACGHTDHADANASKNILKRGMPDFERSYRSLVREVTRVESLMETMKPEEVKTSPLPEHGNQSTPSGGSTIKVQFDKAKQENASDHPQSVKRSNGNRSRLSGKKHACDLDTGQLSLDLWIDGDLKTG